MGDIGAVEANGVVMKERLVSTNPDPSTISDDHWAVAEETTQEVVNSIHPTLDSEEERNDVIDYVQRLIKCSLGFEVFPYGSVPLKTFLPDGDIDLTVLHNPCAEESWASDIISVLKAEEHNEKAEYEVKDTQFIDAEVKLVKCLVQNIVIDISFNQMGGLCTLCFLEQVDRIVGKNHLFKRSIVLIKAWCYYESRILGAHHGLISTYALETLVLYIIHLFFSSLNGPLAVLYRFLDYFSKFDWENYCISLSGPVCKSSLPNIVVEMPKNKAYDLFLSKELLSHWMEMFSFPFRESETSSRAFLPKHLNIIDPLKEYNNLGRSVHRGNFYRIRSALKHGARKLGQILSLPREQLADGIKKFFSNTLQCHERKRRPDTENYVLPYGSEGFSTFYPFSPGEALSEDEILLRSYTCDFKGSMKVVSSQMTSECSYSLDGAIVSGHFVNGDYDFATYSSADFRTSNGTSDCSPSSNHSGSFFGQYYQVPLLHLAKSSTENGHFNQSDPSDGVEEKLDPVPWHEDTTNDLEMVNTYHSCEDNWDGVSSCSSAVSSPKTSILESLSLDCRERDSASVVDSEPLNPLADLCGDYDSHLRSLYYGQCCLGFTLSVPVVSNSAASPHGKNLDDAAHEPRPVRSNSFSQTNSNAWEPPARISRSYSSFASEEKHRGRGTGTFLPNTFSRDRPSQGRVRNKESGGHGQFQRQTRCNSFVPAFSDTNASGKGSHEVFNAWGPAQTHKKPGVINQPCHPKDGGDAHANGYSNSSYRITFGSLGNLADNVLSRPSTVGSSTTCASAVEPTSTPHSSKGDERVSYQLFHLKNEDEFPPLSL